MDPKAQLTTAIRGWIHTDNLVDSFNAQARNAREVRAGYETSAIRLMKDMGIAHSKIQVSGAELQLVQKRQPGPPTWTYLEREIPAWATKSGLTPAQAAGLLKWLHEHRDEKEVECLVKKVSGGKSDARGT